MDRRSFLRGLVAAPAVISIPGLLMPVKAMPVPFAYVSGVWLDGTEFVKEVWDPMPAMNVARMDWFDDVKWISGFEYTSPAMKQMAKEHEQYQRRMAPYYQTELNPMAPLKNWEQRTNEYIEPIPAQVRKSYYDNLADWRRVAEREAALGIYE